MSILFGFRALLYVLGIVGVCRATFLFIKRPSARRITLLYTTSLLALYLGFLSRYAWLVVKGVRVQASVIEVDCRPEKKHYVHYNFQAQSITIEDWALDGYGNPKCDNLKPGDLGFATYLSADPTIHVWGNEQEHLIERLFGLLLIVIFVPLFSKRAIKKRLLVIG
ncbi:MAG: hypothetical protein H7235_11460 [Bdellovibrionaceae bacterium]|nr:hypothetical protein [Pseudobdellovibrionaceae bacterium]